MPNTREKILGYLKFGVFLWATLFGFFTTYAWAWVGIGFPVDWWASLLIIALTVLTEWGFIKWLMD